MWVLICEPEFLICTCNTITSIYSTSSPLWSPSGNPLTTLLAAMTSSKKWASIISSTASCIYFLVIILQIPLFRVPCRAAICTSPMEVTSSQLIAFELLPLVIVKGAVANAFVKNKAIPSYDKLMLYEFTNVKATTAISDLQRLEVLAGSYLSVAEALVGLLKPGRMSLFGILLILWGLVREIILRRSMSTYHIYIYPGMSIAMFSAFLSITKDVRRIIRSFRGPRIVKAKRL